MHTLNFNVKYQLHVSETETDVTTMHNSDEDTNEVGWPPYSMCIYLYGIMGSK